MSCDLDLGTIEFPTTKTEEVKALLKELDIEEVFSIEERKYPNKEYSVLVLQEWDVSWGTSIAADKLLTRMATILKDTPQDGQIVLHGVDDAMDWHILVNGVNHQYGLDLVEISTFTPVPPGKVVDAVISVQIMGLGGCRAAIVGYPKEDKIEETRPANPRS
jgi:hypothetical protein